MNWIAVSQPIHEDMAVYRNDPQKRPVIETSRELAVHGMHESILHLPLHTGTHIDYPLHALPGGKSSSDYQMFPAEFDALVVDVTRAPVCIGLDEVRDLPLPGVEAVFIKTRRTLLRRFDPDFPWLTGEGAAWLAQFPLRFVGIDQLGIERNQPDHPTHRHLLGRDILIIEGLDLSSIDAGRRRFRAFSLGLRGVEAEPLLVFAAPVQGRAQPSLTFW
jgi:arylformamidase